MIISTKIDYLNSHSVEEIIELSLKLTQFEPKQLVFDIEVNNMLLVMDIGGLRRLAGHNCLNSVHFMYNTETVKITLAVNHPACQKI